MSGDTRVARWGEQLRAWAIPDEILSPAPESPYGFPAELFRHRAPAERGETPTTLRALDALPEGGTVLDVGCGGGATSLPLAGHAGRIVGVDGQEDMLANFLAAARAQDVPCEAVRGTWPTVAPEVDAADVVVCGHVLYNAPDLGPFARALDDHARRRVVLEITERHPLSWMNDLWQRFHGLRRPDGPTSGEAEACLRELGFDVQSQERVELSNRARGGFENRDDAVGLVRRRLCLPDSFDREVIEALGDRLRESGGLWSAGPMEQKIVTLWWDSRPQEQ